MKCGEIVGSPPENCTDICRRGLIVIALSRISLISSMLSSWTKPTWFASMKQGSHIMLQRLVRSTVNTAPRPYLIVLDPWLCNFSSLCAWISRPGNMFSICVRNLESMAIMSSKWPCTGQSFTIQISPSRSIICALISPTFSRTSTETSCSPFRIDSRASITQLGHSESVVRGQPSVGLVFCHDFSNGLSDHFGVKDGFGRYLLI